MELSDIPVPIWRLSARHQPEGPWFDALDRFRLHHLKLPDVDIDVSVRYEQGMQVLGSVPASIEAVLVAWGIPQPNAGLRDTPAERRLGGYPSRTPA